MSEFSGEFGGMAHNFTFDFMLPTQYTGPSLAPSLALISPTQRGSPSVSKRSVPGLVGSALRERL